MKLKSIRSKGLVWMMVLILLITVPLSAAGQGGSSGTFKKEELEQLLAPVALYPDSLLAQLLMAATYPGEVAAANRWVSQNRNLKGDQLDSALQNKDWDVSVKSLAHMPQILQMMNDKMDWTIKVGDAFLAQQSDVMQVIQSLRAKAHAAGNLKQTKQQNVIVEKDIIRIEPAAPDVVYVPTYDPVVVYGPWWSPAYPPYPVYYPGWVPGVGLAAGAIGFAAGFAVGASVLGWAGFGWGNREVVVNYNRTINYNKNVINNRDRNVWQHDWNHRGAAPYKDPSIARGLGPQGPARQDPGAGRGDKGGMSPSGGPARGDDFGRQAADRGKADDRGMTPDKGLKPDKGFDRGSDMSSGKDGRDQGRGFDSFGGPKEKGDGFGSAFHGYGDGRMEGMASDRGRSSFSDSDMRGLREGGGEMRGGGDMFRGGGMHGGGGGMHGGRR